LQNSPGAGVDYRNRQTDSGLLKFIPDMETGHGPIPHLWGG